MSFESDSKSRMSVHNLDASLFLSEYVSDISGKCFIYIDPPYYKKGAFLYQNHYKHEDHVNLSRVVSKIRKFKWVVSYDNSEQISEMYKRFTQELFSIDYTARNYDKGTEIMIFSRALMRPKKVYCTEKERKFNTAA